MGRGGGAGKVVDAIDFEFKWVDHVMTNKFEVGILPEVGDVCFAACEEVINAYNLVAAG